MGEKKEQRFRCSIYVDIFIPEEIAEENGLDLEAMKAKALEKAKEAKDAIEGFHNIGSAYVGGAAWFPSGGTLDPKVLTELDKI